MIINIIIVVLTLLILSRSRSSVCDTSRADERDQAVAEEIQAEPTEEIIYNISSNKYSYAYCSNKHCIQIGNAIYFAGEQTPYGKLLTATPSRLICEVSPTEYNVVYRDMQNIKAVTHATATEK